MLMWKPLITWNSVHLNSYFTHGATISSNQQRSIISNFHNPLPWMARKPKIKKERREVSSIPQLTPSENISLILDMHCICEGGRRANDMEGKIHFFWYYKQLWHYKLKEWVVFSFFLCYLDTTFSPNWLSVNRTERSITTAAQNVDMLRGWA